MKAKLFYTLLCIAALFCGGCVEPEHFQEDLPQKHGPNCSIKVEDFEDGFEVALMYREFQVTTASSNVSIKGRSKLLKAVKVIAQARKRQLKPYGQTDIKTKMFRNDYLNQTHWRGKLRVYYLDKK